MEQSRVSSGLAIGLAAAVCLYCVSSNNAQASRIDALALRLERIQAQVRAVDLSDFASKEDAERCLDLLKQIEFRLEGD